MPFGPRPVRWYAPIGRRLTPGMVAGLLALAGAPTGAMAQTAGIQVSAIVFEGQPAQRVANVQVRAPGSSRAGV